MGGRRHGLDWEHAPLTLFLAVASAAKQAYMDLISTYQQRKLRNEREKEAPADGADDISLYDDMLWV